MRRAYLYYRIVPSQAAIASARIDALLASMAGHCSRPPHRLARCDDPETWMEIYEGIADFEAFSAALNASAQRFGCEAFTQGERHMECFVPAGALPDRADENRG